MTQPSQATPPATEPTRTVAARRRDPRLTYGLLGLLGVALFVAGVAMILAGRPGLLNLGLGIVGVLLAVPGLYGLLGASATPAAAPSAEPAPETEPFHPKAVDTK